MMSGGVPTFMCQKQSQCSLPFVHSVIRYLAPKLISENGAPLANWIFYVAAILEPYIPSIACATYTNTAKSGLSTVPLVQGLVLPPDAFVPDGVKCRGKSR